MLYTDEELREWWSGLSIMCRIETLAVMIEKMEDFGLSLARQYESGKEFSPKQLAAIRKWYHG